MTTTECAERAGMKPPVWSNWENDRSRSREGRPSQPRAETLEAIAVALDVDIEVARNAAYGGRQQNDGDEWKEIIDRVPPSKRGEFVRAVRTMAEMVAA